MGLVAAAQSIPDAGLRAEMQEQWPEAVEVYIEALKVNPAQADLWERIADIRATRIKDSSGAVQAMREAVKYAPSDARLYSKLSQACSAARDGPAALSAINRAIELEPGNMAYLRARAEIATWLNDYTLALDSFEKVLAITPEDADSILGAARAASRSGNQNVAVLRYRAYLERHQQDKTVMLEYMAVEAAQGNIKVVKEYDVLYRKRFGASKEYWLNMADMYDLGQDSAAASAALKEATRFAPDDAALFYRLAQSYPTEEMVKGTSGAKAASEAMERAMYLDTKNLEYLRARADMASELGDYAMVLDSYQRILAIAPGDLGAELGIARVQYWQGKLDSSRKSYRNYLVKQSAVAVAWMEYAVVLAELGDYARAMELLEVYRQRFGDNINYRKHKARVLAWAEHPTSALALVGELEPTLPDDYELGYTRTVALHYANQPREALASLVEVTRLRPNDKETTDLARFIKTPLRSSITATYGYSSDSDDIAIQNAGLSGEYAINPTTRIFGGTDRQKITAAVGSGYMKPDGGTSINYYRTWLGLKHRFSPKLSLDGQVGNGHAESDGRLIYELGANYKPNDKLGMRLSHHRDLYAVSPRAAKLGIERRTSVLDTTWTPNLRYTVNGHFAYDTFSDGNNRWEAEVAPRRAFLRTQRFNLDVGISGHWFGFDRDLGNGYYAPSNYERYTVTAFTYWKISDDDGVSVTFSTGPYKDNTMSGFRTGGDIVAEGTFGLYRNWFLDVKGGLSHYGGSATPGYGSHTFEVSLTRRF